MQRGTKAGLEQLTAFYLTLEKSIALIRKLAGSKDRTCGERGP